MVTKVENQAQIGNETAAVGTLVHMNDALSTGAKAHLQVTFRDKTELTLGENASVVIDRYVFDPDAGVGEAALNATKGAFRFATGRLSEMPKKDINVSTPFAAMAVRGTDFWWGPIKGQSGVLLVSNSRLEVRKEDCREGTDTDRRRCRCAVTLKQAEEGTYIDRRTGCPGIPRQWTPGEVDAALSQTSFSLALGPTQQYQQQQRPQQQQQQQPPPPPITKITSKNQSRVRRDFCPGFTRLRLQRTIGAGIHLGHRTPSKSFVNWARGGDKELAQLGHVGVCRRSKRAIVICPTSISGALLTARLRPQQHQGQT